MSVLGQAVTPIVARPRLASLFTFSGGTRVIVLLAAAGYGKSQAVRSNINKENWITFRVGSAGASFARFVRGFAQAIAGIAPAASASFPRVWERALQSESPENVLARWLCEHLQEIPRDIFIDDLHNAAANSRIAAFISEFVRIRYDRRLIITARAPGLLPLPLWMATGVVGRPIDENMLRFTSVETRALAKLSGQPSPNADIGKRAVHGCPVAVAYLTAQQSMCYPFGPIADCGSFAAVAEQVFANRTSRERHFLLSASLLPQLDPNLLSMAGWPDWPILRDAMNVDASFMWEAEIHGHVRFHDRFTDFLASRRNVEEPSLRNDMATRAVRVLEDASRYGDALQVAVQQGLLVDVSRLIDKHGFDILESGHVDEVSEALDAIDASDTLAPAVVTALRGYVDARLGRFDTSESWFQHGLQRASTDESRAAIALYYARELMRQLRDDAFEVLEPYADLTTLSEATLIDVRSSVAQAYMVADRTALANARITQAMSMFRPHFSAALRARVLARAAYVAFETGNAESARRYARSAVAIAVTEGLYDVATSVYTVLYTLAYEVDDDPASCLDYLTRIRECGMKSGTMRLDLYALVGMYELYAEAGDRLRLAELERAIHATDMQHSLSFSESFLPARAMQAGWAGDFAYGFRVLAPTADRQPTDVRKALRWSEVMLYAAASGDRSAAYSAESAVSRHLTQDSSPSTHRGFAALYCALAFCVLHEVEKAKVWAECAKRSAVPGAKRVKALHSAVECIINASRDSSEAAQLPISLAALREAGFGGMALLIESLPLPILTNSYRLSVDSYGGRIAAERLDELFPLAVASRSDESRLFDWLQEMQQEETQSRRVRGMLAAWTPPFPVVSVRARDIAEAIRTFAIVRSAPKPLPSFAPDEDVDAKIDALFVELARSAPLMAEHSKAVSLWCARIARRLGFDEDHIVYVARCGLLHDIGKAKTPDFILNAPRQLEPGEWEIMRDHAAEGGRIAAAVPALARFSPIVRGHHERLDGKGYPDGLRSGAIPLACRIVSVADCFNAMIGRRAYRLPMSPTNALDQLDRNRGTQFDPEIVEAMISIVTGSVVLKSAS